VARVETIVADMAKLPLPDAMADLCLTYSGLHAVAEPQRALGEVVRCLKPGGRLVGSSFTTSGTRRQQRLFAVAQERGEHVPRATRRDLDAWLRDTGVGELRLEGDGFVVFSGVKR
jgi:ubiquinone/menaquinone biosynthesis C-methylase UbiE